VQVRQAVGVHHLPALQLRKALPRPAERVGALARLAVAGVQLGHQLGDRSRPTGPQVVPGVEDPQEDPLRPAVVVRVRGDDAAARVVCQAQPPQLRAEDLHVALGGDPRVLAGGDRVLLGGQPEGVEAHGVEQVVAGHPQVAAVDVGADVAERVADVQPVAARVREHVIDEVAGPLGHGVEAVAQRPDRVGRVEGALTLPAVLPCQLDPLGQRGRVAKRRDLGFRHRMLLAKSAGRVQPR
jgi:hypothetical protein